MQESLARAIDTYQPLGAWEFRWAKGKMANDPVFERVGEHVERLAPTRLLDVGCGEGYLLAYVRALRPQTRLWGLDYDPRRLAVARRALGEEPDLELLEADVREATLPEVDVVTCLDVLHYLPPQGQDGILARMVEALRPGGTLLLRDGEAGAGLRSWLTLWSERIAVLLGRHKGATVHLRTREQTRSVLEALGLEVDVVPCSEGTILSNVLFVARRPESP